MASNCRLARASHFVAAALLGDRIPDAFLVRYGLAIAIFEACLVAQLAMPSVAGSVEFVFLYPGIVLSTLLLGEGPGLATLAVSVAAIGFVFEPEFWASEFEFTYNAPLVVFCVSGSVIVLVGHLVRRQRAVLRESQKRFLQLFDAAPVGQLLIGLDDLRILKGNSSAAGIYGVRTNDLPERSIKDFEVSGESMINPEIQMRLLAEGQAQFETRIRRADGEIRDLSNTVVLSNWAQNNVYHVTQIDITERKWTEARDHLRGEILGKH